MDDFHSLPQKDARFCRLFARCRDPDAAARDAGISPAHARRLLDDPNALRFIDCHAALLRRQSAQSSLALLIDSLDLAPELDLARLLALARNARDGEVLDSFPLPNLSEVKLAKDGAIELKFFDRAKLLELLCSLAGPDGSGQKSLVDAIQGSARELYSK